MTDRAVVSDEVTFVAGGRTIPGTLTRPAGAARASALLLMAGSGPTDRNWTSPLLPGTNGSAGQLAAALAERGIVSLRFDKSYSGKNPGVPLPELTLDTYQVEARAALDFLAARPEVDPHRLFAGGHSEGGIHVTRLALGDPGRLAGVALLAAPGRTLREILITQLSGNFRNAAKMTDEQVEAQMGPIRTGLAAFAAGQDVAPESLSAIPQVQAIFKAMMAPPVAALGRALISFDPPAEAVNITAPILVLQGGKDIQVEPDLDARPLVAALRAAGRDVTYHLSPDANHVFKHEAKTVDEARANPAAVQTGYCADDGRLDPDIVAALADWVLSRPGTA